MPAAAEALPTGGWWLPGRREDGLLAGLARYWTADGAPERVVYHRAGQEVARFPRGEARANPLIEAARDGDAASVELCLAAGLGASPGAAWHAAYEGLPELALRLLRSGRADGTGHGGGTGRGGGTGHGGGTGRAGAAERADGTGHVGAVDPADAVELAEVRNPPAAPSPGVPEDAVWVAGMLAFVAGGVEPTTGAAVGTWRWWTQAWHQTSDATGPSYHAPDSCYHGYAEADFVDGRPAERRAYLSSGRLYRVERYRPDGARLSERKYSGGVPEQEWEWPADGTVIRRRFHRDGALRVERTERDGELVAERWYDADGTRTVEVAPTGATVEGEPVEHCRALGPGGAVVAEGHADPGMRGGPVGVWNLFGADGAALGEVSFDGLGLARDERIGRSAHALQAWRAAPVPSELDGAEAVPWGRLGTFFGDSEEVPFLLKGLSVANPDAISLALAQLSHMLLHQHTIAEAAGPAFRYMTALAGRPVEAGTGTGPGPDPDPGPGIGLLELLAGIATRDGDPDAVRELKRIRADLPAGAADPGEHYARSGAEPAHHHVHTALTEAVPTWGRLAAHRSTGIRRPAVALLAAAPGEAAARALHDRLAHESEPGIRAEILLGLGLHEPDDNALRALERHLADDDPLLRFCAALTWVRRRPSAAGPGARILVEALRGGLDTDGFEGLYLGTGDPTTDTVTTLALLPPEQTEGLLAGLCAALDEVDPVDAASVANALLDIVFPTAAYGEGEPLTDGQRTVIRAIADSTNAWEFNVNLYEVLDVNGLPRAADVLRALADTAPAGSR
ncbi:hypothetical protein ACIRS1_21465 [Kitasatospora sp. NPDC101176]|uniref:hypothetical protein n=1 Tax=Kitasatospora sp. NPDC101176 TaxID=3364099 RepID=UPI00382C988A